MGLVQGLREDGDLGDVAVEGLSTRRVADVEGRRSEVAPGRKRDPWNAAIGGGEDVRATLRDGQRGLGDAASSEGGKTESSVDHRRRVDRLVEIEAVHGRSGGEYHREARPGRRPQLRQRRIVAGHLGGDTGGLSEERQWAADGRRQGAIRHINRPRHRRARGDDGAGGVSFLLQGRNDDGNGEVDRAPICQPKL